MAQVISLPLSKEEIAVLQRKHVLVIDDFANVRKSIKGMLHTIGIKKVVEANSANQAIVAMRENHFDVVICDYNLGPGRDGQQLLEEVRFNNTLSFRTVYVMITAETSRDMVMGAIEFQPDDYLAKPFAFDTLKQRIVRWFLRQKTMDKLFLALDNKNHEKIIEQASLVINKEPRFKVFAQKKAIEAYIALEQCETPLKMIKEINGDREQSWTKIYLAQIALIQNKMDDAVDILKESIDKDPNLIGAYDLLSECYLKKHDDKRAQDVLQKGVQRSPRNIVRQKNLGELSLKLDDMITASKAFKEVVSLSDQTMHDSPDNNENLVRSLKAQLDLMEDENPEKRKLLLEVQSQLKSFSTKYKGNDSVRLFCKVFQYKIENSTSDKDKSNVMDGFLEKALMNADEISVDLGEEIAQLLFEDERYKDVDQLIHTLKENHKGETKILEKLDAIQAEPVDKVQREKAQKLNVLACKQYEEKSFEKSSDTFNQALKISPRHPGMILNYIQSRMQSVNKEDHPIKVVNNCMEYAERLNYLEKDHYQYQRYINIVNKLKQYQKKYHE
ncbi:MAG: response regulator [Saccharospirillaceae bacterium]|nr:response regulator [Pseudomonadales bacterium]NRB78264.1 response regulator [Saccharospirillaceae bacterium]